MSRTLDTAEGTRVASKTSATARRYDVDGLRFIAIALVVVYHVWFGRVSGGVDVFLLISAFLLTESFLRRIERGSRTPLRSFWIRRFARLLPAAAVTMIGVLAFAAFALPASTWPETWSQTWASLFYVENWQLALSSVDYYARDETLPSLLQHFWSLSMQGQVFVIWPVLFLGIGAVSRRVSTSPRVIAAWAFGTVFVISLAYSMIATVERQEFTYFDTGARLWEFALGSLAAVAAPFVRPTRSIGSLLAAVGLLGLVTCGLVFDVGAGFPGYIALWPTLCAVAIIFAGQSRTPGLLTRGLSSAPMRRAGRIAYSLYLVHWPILIGYMALTGTSEVGLWGGAIVVSISVLVAVILHALVEHPLQAHPLRGSDLLTLVAAALVVATPLALWQGSERLRAATVQVSENPGAGVLLPGSNIQIEEDAERIPLGSALDAEWVGLPDRCDGEVRPAARSVRDTCTHLSAHRNDAPTVLVIGDSHAEQWMGALIPVAEEHDWNMVAVLKGGCSVGLTENKPSDTECREWQRNTIQYALDLDADVVVMMGTKAAKESTKERVPRGLHREVRRIADSGSEVVLLRDNPRFSEDMFECVEQRGPDDPACSRQRDEVLAAENPAGVLQGERVIIVDLTEYLCPRGTCLPAIGNVAVYLDDNHLTGSYARTLAPAMEAALSDLAILR